MEKYPALIVVEGKTDKDLIESFLMQTLSQPMDQKFHVKQLISSKMPRSLRSVVVLTDPDAPGKRIRDILNANIPGSSSRFHSQRKSD
jgi:ribonuclease M5